MAGPWYISASGPVHQDGSPVLITQAQYEDCCCAEPPPVWASACIHYQEFWDPLGEGPGPCDPDYIFMDQPAICVSVVDGSIEWGGYSWPAALGEADCKAGAGAGEWAHIYVCSLHESEAECLAECACFYWGI